MYGDFSLNPLAYRDRVSRVLSQQGRVQLDSDANEQTESVLRFLRGLAFDTLGAHGGVGNAFELVHAAATADVTIRWGTYYVDGVRCRNLPADFDIFKVATGTAVPDGVDYGAQPHMIFAKGEEDWTKGAAGDVVFYLDAYERHISAAEDESLREVALLGADTASRAAIVWQVRTMPFDRFDKAMALLKALPATWADTWDDPYLALNLALRSRAQMRARAVISDTTNPCIVSPDARYRGTDNRLFRVEVHDPGPKATFKWSPDNAAIVYPLVHEIEGKTVHLASLGRDDRTMLQVNDWVEVVDDRVQLMGQAHPLLQVVDIRPYDMTVTLSDEPQDNAGGNLAQHPILRRWAGPPVPIRGAAGERDGWFELADGVEVQFSVLLANDPRPTYRTGDYWLVPTRTATGDVQWPKENRIAVPLPPHGVDHHYAPLARIDPKAAGVKKHFRRVWKPIANPV